MSRTEREQCRYLREKEAHRRAFLEDDSGYQDDDDIGEDECRKVEEEEEYRDGGEVREEM